MQKKLFWALILEKKSLPLFSYFHPMKKVEVVAAVIMNQNEILVVQRGKNKYSYISEKFEFPGGKMEEEETREDAIKREVLEELKMTIVPLKELITVEYEYPDFYLTMHAFLCSTESRDLELTEHIDYKWLAKDKLMGLDWAAADVPIVEMLMKA